MADIVSAAHTPGPWVAKAYHSEVDYFIESASGSHLADVYRFGGDDSTEVAATPTETAANACLIAAAPDLLAALEAAKRKHHECEDSWFSCPKSEGGCCNDAEGDECNCGAERHNAAIDAAIAKARGQS